MADEKERFGLNSAPANMRVVTKYTHKFRYQGAGGRIRIYTVEGEMEFEPTTAPTEKTVATLSPTEKTITTLSPTEKVIATTSPTEKQI